MTYTKYLLFSILVVCPSVLSAQGITRRIHQIDEVTVWDFRSRAEFDQTAQSTARFVHR